MRIAFDGICLGDGVITGVARAFLGALTAYAARGDAECLLLVPPGVDAPHLSGVTNVPAPRGALRRQLRLPALLRRLGADLLHSSVAAIPLAAPCPTLAPAHDLPWRHDEAGERTPWRRRAAVTRSLRAATVVLAPSTFTRDDVVAVVGDARKVHLVPHGVPLLPAMPPFADRRGPWLTLGDDRPRKNRALTRAGHTLARRQQASLPELRFVGPPDAFVDEAEKAQLLRTCRGVVQLSRFEGFGLPVLEAMAHGAPLLCADIPPFRELAGDAALFCVPDSAASIAAAMSAFAEPAAAHRLAVRGFARAAAFAITTTAQRWHELHRSLRR